MLIAIDANEANVQNRVGIGQYAFEILKNLYHLDKSNKYYIYLKNPPQLDLPKPHPNWQYKIFGPKPLWTQFALPLQILKDKPRLLYSPGHYIPFLNPCPAIPTIHDLGYLQSPDQFTKKDYYQLKIWTEASLKTASQLIAVSDFTKSEIQKIYHIPASKITVVKNGVGEPIKTTNLIDQATLKKFHIDSPYFLYLGTLKPNKNIPFLIESFAKLNDSNFQLVIAGKKGWLYDEIFQKISQLKLTNQIIFTGFINETEKWVLLKQAQALVIPSLYEGFGRPAIEAMKVDTPVIASRIPSLQEVVGPAGLFINPHQPQTLVDALKKVQKKSTRQKLVKLGRSQSQLFSWQSSVSNLLSLFKTF